MPSYVLPDIRRGRMTPEDKLKIEELAISMKNPSPGKIARAIKRHPATVNWFMLTRGLIERRARHASGPYVRKGKTIYPYSAEQDDRLEELRAQQHSFSAIAEVLKLEFPIDRAGVTAHSVQVRMVQLSADPNREVA